MKIRYKIFWLIIIVLVTFPLRWTLNISYAIKPHLFLYHSFREDSRHFIGYMIIGYLFGWPSLVCGVIDEGLQYFIKDKGFYWHQLWLNLEGATIGLIVRQFIKTSFINPFRKKNV